MVPVINKERLSDEDCFRWTWVVCRLAEIVVGCLFVACVLYSLFCFGQCSALCVVLGGWVSRVLVTCRVPRCPPRFSWIQVAPRQDVGALRGTMEVLQAALAERGVRCEEVSGRPKNLYGIWTKMRAAGQDGVDKVRVWICKLRWWLASLGLHCMVVGRKGCCMSFWGGFEVAHIRRP
jgi:hypothetical protein